ncbi:hypothetical protein [Rhodococcus xishaensis]|uniref:Uncharacterized protein n=1 Tax=Rhodococcus xishaensis TaxID=2487364 RepID=A0A438AWA8_9NOCA|nr:hypothetical protein [Rhodococcus xishaensis]RVW02997.1 hypothetical protein EGT50_09815 [Rhodococcus xishaensis]
MSTLVQLVLAMLTGGAFSTIVHAVMNRRRSNAEAAQIIAEAAASLVGPLNERLGQHEQRIQVLEAENAHKTTLLDEAIGFIRDLLAWAGRLLPGERTPDIPDTLRDELQL